MFLRVVADLVAHFFRAVHPIAEIDMGQAQFLRAGYMIENKKSAKGALLIIRVKNE